MTNTKNKFIFGAIILLICNLLTKLLGAIYRVPLLKVLGSDGLGLYQLVFPIYALMLVIITSGVSVSLSKFISKEVSVKNIRNQKTFLKAGFFISFTISLLITLILAIISPVLSKYQGESRLFYCYLALLPSLVISSLVATFKGYFLGQNKMLYTGTSQIVGQVVKLVASLCFAIHFVKYGVIYAVIGAVLGVTVAEIFTLLYLLVLFLVKHKKSSNEVYSVLKSNLTIKKNSLNNTAVHILYNLKEYNCRNITIKQAVKKILKFGIFISLEASVIPLTGAIDSLIVVPLLLRSGFNNTVAYTLFGLEDGIVSSLISMPTIIATSFGASIIPNIKKSKQISDATTKNINESIKLVWLFTLACACVFVFFSAEIANFLYAGGLNNKIIVEIDIVKDLLKLNAFNIVYLSMLNLSKSILQGLDKNITPVINLSICAIARLLLLLILVPIKDINIYGIAIADMLFYVLCVILNFYSIKKHVKIKFSIKKMLFVPILASSTMCAIMQIFKFTLNGLFSNRILTLIIMLSGFATYLIVLFATKVIDVKNIFKRFAIKRKELN